MTALALPTISERFGPPTARISRRLSSRSWEVNVVDPTRDPDWDGLVASHPGSNFFHSAAWAKVLCRTYGHKPISLLLSRNGEPVALVPLLEVSSPLTGRRGVCLPFTDFCDPLFFGGCDSGDRFEIALRIGSQSKLEAFRNSGRKLLRDAGHSVDEVLRAYVGSSEWPGSAFYGDSRVRFDGRSARPNVAT